MVHSLTSTWSACRVFQFSGAARSGSPVSQRYGRTSFDGRLERHADHDEERRSAAAA